MDFISSATCSPAGMDSNANLLPICPIPRYTLCPVYCPSLTLTNIPWTKKCICLQATLVNCNNGLVTNRMESAVSHFRRMNNYIKRPTYGKKKKKKKRDLAMDAALVIQLE